MIIEEKWNFPFCLNESICTEGFSIILLMSNFIFQGLQEFYNAMPRTRGIQVSRNFKAIVAATEMSRRERENPPENWGKEIRERSL
jgi:hypothetical protein